MNEWFDFKAFFLYRLIDDDMDSIYKHEMHSFLVNEWWITWWGEDK